MKGVFMRVALLKARGYLCLLLQVCKPCLEGRLTIGLRVELCCIFESVVPAGRSKFRHA